MKYRIITNYPDYKITPDGKVFSKKRGEWKQLKPHLGKIGYLTVGLGGRTTYIHRLVGEHFIRRIKGKTNINHIDGDKTNNHVSNLEWCTQSENLSHAFKIGARSNKGEGGSSNKLKTKQVIQIYNDITVKGLSVKALAIKHNVSERCIYDIVLGNTWGILGLKPIKMRILKKERALNE